MPIGKYINDKLKAPFFNNQERTWDVEYKDRDKWEKQSFNSHSQAYNFYLDKWELYKYWFQISKGR